MPVGVSPVFLGRVQVMRSGVHKAAVSGPTMSGQWLNRSAL
jgi:hypothetical protein